MAARFQTGQGGLAFGRQWISPLLFPFYTRVLWFNLGISGAIFVIVLTVLALTGNPLTLTGIFNSLLIQVGIQFAIVTGIFIAVERSMPTIDWKRSTKGSHPAFWAIGSQRSQNKGQTVSRFESIAQIVALVVLLLWLRSVVAAPQFLFGPASATYQLGPIWDQVVIPALLLFVLFIAQSVINLIRPDWTQLPFIVRVLSDVASLAILTYLLLHGSQFVVLTHPGISSPETLDMINRYVGYSLWCLGVGMVAVAVVDAWKLLHHKQQTAA